MSLFNKAEQRALTFQDIWSQGRDVVHNSATVDQALRLIPVYSCVRILAESVASLPIKEYRKLQDVREEIKLSEVFRHESDQSTNSFRWAYELVVSLALRGNAYGIITATDAMGVPTHIMWVHPDDVSIEDNERPSNPGWFYRGRRVPQRRMVHITAFSLPGQVLGISPIRAFQMTTETGLLAQEFGRDWFKNGSVPAGVLETDQRVSDEDARIVKSRFKEAASNRDVAALGVGVSYRPITVNPDESQFLETAKMTATQIAAIYGVPPEMVGGETAGSLTYSTAEMQTSNFVTFTLRPWLTRLEAVFSDLLPRGRFIRFNVDQMIRVDVETRYNSYHSAREIGLMSINEIRLLEDLPPIDGGDDHEALLLQQADMQRQSFLDTDGSMSRGKAA